MKKTLHYAQEKLGGLVEFAAPFESDSVGGGHDPIRGWAFGKPRASAAAVASSDGSDDLYLFGSWEASSDIAELLVCFGLLGGQTDVAVAFVDTHPSSPTCPQRVAFHLDHDGQGYDRSRQLHVE